MRVLRLILAVALLYTIVSACCPPIEAQGFSHILSFQGRLAATDGKPLPDGDYSVTFKIYSSAIKGTPLWTETQTVTQIGGVFDVKLGTVAAFPDTLFAGGDRWLGITVGAELEMLPRVQFTPSPWAINAGTDNDWTISGDNIYRLTGKVGIGTDSPTASLEVRNDNTVNGIYSVTSYIPIYGYRNVTTGTFPGVQGTTDSLATGASGVRGYVTSTTPGSLSAGVYGYNYGTAALGAGVRGYHAGNGMGVYGEAAGATGYGGYFVGEQNYFQGKVGIGTAVPDVKLHVLGGTDASLASGGYAVIGSVGSTNLCIDNNEILARYNGTPTSLYFNNTGGTTYLGSDAYDGTGAYVMGNGHGRAGATIRAHNYQTDTGVALYTTSVGSWTNTHLENNGTGEVLWLQRNNSSNAFIVCNNTDTATQPFRVNADGHTYVTVLEITGGADLSEQFRVTAPSAKPEPGMVVCIDPDNPGDLIVSCKAYDRTVAGIISGAGGVTPGMRMGQKDTIADGDHPVALTGRVWCWCDASAGAIEPGDMLTTSDVAGHAMKVADYSKSQGTIIGKAMTNLKSGRGLVMVLVGLQ